VVISSEMPELLGITDRIYVMNEGRIVGEMPPRKQARKKSCAPSFVEKEKQHEHRKPPLRGQSPEETAPTHRRSALTQER
jgi:ABC-type multidrug transport system ATPase subunit